MKKFQIILCLSSLLVLSVTTRADAQSPTPSSSDSTPAMADAASAPIDPAKVAEIRKLLALTGTVKMTRQVMDQMITAFRTQNSSVSPEFWDRFEKEMNLDELVDKMIPVYAKYYTLDELKAVNAFYETPVGQKVLAATPQIMHESMQIGQDWGRAVAARLLAELSEEKEKASAAPATK